MGPIATQITSLTVVYSTVYSDADQSKHQSSASLALVWGSHRDPVNSPHKWSVTRKMFPSDDVIMTCCNLSYDWLWWSAISHAISRRFPWLIVRSIVDHNDRSCDYLRLLLRLIFFNSIQSHGMSYNQSCEYPRNNRRLRLHSQVVEHWRLVFAG